MNHSPRFANEIERLMRDPDSMRDEWDRMQRSGRPGSYHPNQPRVPAGQSGGGQWTGTDRNIGTSALAQAQTQPKITPEQIDAICALDPAKIAPDFANPFLKGVGRVDPITGQVRTLDWVRQQAYQMEQLVRELQKQLCRPA